VFTGCNEQFIELELKLTAEVVKASAIISIFPVFLKLYVFDYTEMFSLVKSHINFALQCLT
jgi:hypothetical protein